MQKETFAERFGPNFETTLVYLLLTNKGFAETSYNGLDETLFHDPAYREIISTFSRISAASNGALPTWRSIQAELIERNEKNKNRGTNRSKAVEAALTRLGELRKRTPPSAADIEYTQQQLENFVTIRNLHAALLESVDLMQEGKFDEVQSIIEDAVQSGKLRAMSSAGLEFTNYAAKIKAYTEKRDTTTHGPVGITKIDSCMRGGIEPKRLGVFMAAPGVGKTLCMVNAGVHALLSGVDVVHITLEIDEIETSQRYDARLLGIPINEIAKNVDRYTQRIMDASHKLRSRLFIKEWGSSEATVNDIRAYLRFLDLNYNCRPGLVIVDYVDLLLPVKANNERRMEIAVMYRQLRQVARDYQCAIWTGSQITKEGYDQETLTLRSIYESGEKAAVADIVLGLCQTKAERTKGAMRVVILKNRQGGREGTQVDCLVNVDTQTIKQSPIQRSAMVGTSVGNINGQPYQARPAGSAPRIGRKTQGQVP